VVTPSLLLFFLFLVGAAIALFLLGVRAHESPNRRRRAAALMLGGGAFLIVATLVTPALFSPGCGCALATFEVRPESVVIDMERLNLTPSVSENLTDDTFDLVLGLDGGPETTVDLRILRSPNLVATLDDRHGYPAVWGSWEAGSSRVFHLRLVVLSSHPEILALSFFGAENTAQATYQMGETTGTIVVDPSSGFTVTPLTSAPLLQIPVRGGGSLKFRFLEQVVCC